ncbi:RHS domain-containing protein [Rhizobium pusense]|nr:RHS domain-containing protein [Agrobacterium pusense]
MTRDQVHTDHLERPIMMTDSARNVVWRATYLPYGEAYTILGSATFDQRLSGAMVPTGIRFALQLASPLRSDDRPLSPGRSSWDARWTK